MIRNNGLQNVTGLKIYMESVKGGLPDSMKRAAYQWGLGRYLYKFESIWVPLREGKLEILYIKQQENFLYIHDR